MDEKTRSGLTTAGVAGILVLPGDGLFRAIPRAPKNPLLIPSPVDLAISVTAWRSAGLPTGSQAQERELRGRE